MTTATGLIYTEQLDDLRKIAMSRKWDFIELEDVRFILGLPARDNSRLALFVECDRFPVVPPAWHWYNAETKAMDQPGDTPTGGNFFHGSGCICAPWNRLAYSSEAAKGPHSDWMLANWMTNPNTRQCTTLSAMALRLYVELQSERYRGRMA
jgi:hypothetical protein